LPPRICHSLTLTLTRAHNINRHWDCTPFTAPEEPSWDAPPAGVHGKLCLTDSTLVAVPETANEPFRRRFVAAYRPHYPNARAGAPKFGLDPVKPDPLGLVARRGAFVIPAGCLAFWSPNLLHGVRCKAKDEAIEFGAYIGFMRAPALQGDSGGRPAYRRLAGIAERDDRVRSYQNGEAPRLWPSLDRIHYFPKRYLNFPKLLAPYHAKARADWPGRTTRAIQSGPRKGEVVPHMVAVRTTAYKRPRLTLLGERLLGLRAWPSSS